VQQPVLFIATYREEEATRAHPLRRLRRELQEEKILFTFTPRSLGRSDVADLLTRVARQPSASSAEVPGEGVPEASVADALLARSGGNPLFLNELIQGLREGRGDPAGDELPETAREAISQRVGRLDERSRALAEVASVAGHGFDVEAVVEPEPGPDWNARFPGGVPVPVYLVVRSRRR